MDKFSDEYFRLLAKDLMFEVSDEEIQELKKDFVEVEKQVQLFESIDTNGIDEMIYPFDVSNTFLREDEIGETLSLEDALSNAKDVQDDLIHIPKVVK